MSAPPTSFQFLIFPVKMPSSCSRVRLDTLLDGWYDYCQCVVSDHHFFGAFLRFLQFDFFIEFFYGKTWRIACPFHQGEIPTPEPPPVTVYLCRFIFVEKFSASVWLKGRQVSLPLILCANTFDTNIQAATAAITIVFLITLF